MAPPTAQPILLKTKLQPPEAVGAIVPPRQLELVASAGRQKLLTVCAPAGYGKTTLLVEASRQLGWTVAWYKLDARDDDPFVFIASLVESLRCVIPAFGATIRARLLTMAESPCSTADLLALFVAALTDEISSEIHIVLDDYHEAADSSSLNEALDFIVEHLPSVVRLVVLTRYRPLFSVARASVLGDATEIGIDDLRFDAEQATACIAARTGHVLDQHTAARLTEVTEGWPASIILASKAIDWLDVTSVEQALADPRLHRDIYAYLAEQVYRRETPSVQSFLKKTCCLDQLTVRLAEILTGARRADKTLARLESTNAFTFANADRTMYRYHNLFRDYLRQRIVVEDGPEVFRGAQLSAAQALAATGDLQAAVYLFFAAADPEAALDAIARASQNEIDACPGETVLSWIDHIPDALHRDSPWPLLLTGIVAMRRREFDVAIEALHTAEARFAAVGDAFGQHHALSALESTFFWKGDMPAADTCCRRAVEIAPSAALRAQSLLGVCAAALPRYDWPTFDAGMAEARLLAGVSSTLGSRVEALTAVRMHAQGHYRQALVHLEMLDSVTSDFWSQAGRVCFMNCLAVIRCNLGEYDSALALATQSLDMASHDGLTFVVPMIRDTAGHLFASMGSLEKALTELEDSAATNERSCDIQEQVSNHCHWANALRRHGDLDGAIAHASKAVTLLCGPAAHHSRISALSTRAFCLGLRGSPEATTVLDLQRRTSERFELAAHANKCDFYAAALEHRQSREHDAMARLRRCIPQQLELGHLNFLAQELNYSPDMTVAALREPWPTGVMAGLVDAIALHWNSLPLLRRLLEISPEIAQEALAASARHRPPEDVAVLTRRAHRHSSPAVRRMARAIEAEHGLLDGIQESLFPELTARENEILSLIAGGFRNAEIADRLFLSPATVKTHINRVFSKLGVGDRVRATLHYRERLKTTSETERIVRTRATDPKT